MVTAMQRQAYINYLGFGNARYSWDPVVVLAAVRELLSHASTRTLDPYPRPVPSTPVSSTRTLDPRILDPYPRLVRAWAIVSVLQATVTCWAAVCGCDVCIRV